MSLRSGQITPGQHKMMQLRQLPVHTVNPMLKPQCSCSQYAIIMLGLQYMPQLKKHPLTILQLFSDFGRTVQPGSQQSYMRVQFINISKYGYPCRIFPHPPLAGTIGHSTVSPAGINKFGLFHSFIIYIDDFKNKPCTTVYYTDG